MGLWGHDKICAFGASALFRVNDKKDKKNYFFGHQPGQWAGHTTTIFVLLEAYALLKVNDKKDKKIKFLDILKTKLSVGISSLFFLSFLSFKNYCCLIVDGKDNVSR